MNNFRNITLIFLSIILGFNGLKAETIEKIPFGDMESWITRNITESKVLGGKKKTIYAIGPTGTIEGATAYTPEQGNPWATSNVLAAAKALFWKWQDSPLVCPGPASL